MYDIINYCIINYCELKAQLFTLKSLLLQMLLKIYVENHNDVFMYLRTYVHPMINLFIYLNDKIASFTHLIHPKITGMNWWTAGNYLHGYWRWDGLLTGGFGFSDWGPGEPNNHGGHQEDCVTLWRGHHGRWNDSPCYQRNYFICQKRA